VASLATLKSEPALWSARQTCARRWIDARNRNRPADANMSSIVVSNNEKVVLVTGASQGIGAGLMRAYRELGYAVIATARSIGPPEDSGIVAVEGDIADPDAAQDTEY
jgi:3-oxoacyl-ACP reductase-like protein